ncbi:uncharacterized protein LOC107270166 isoform X1 [Cephus cinctus]|uniref:Uncharacterized protein LOC107270166 isoform X1 n=2 Tax=Cephus cinctus TaxID=211228 RepID=A0AAJ7FND8_CEPCN|nr:uncharacterized protein LOC107270166 isoform X1 [Cephus cinctus]
MTVPEEMAAEVANKKAEREALRGVIQQWNANRLDLFELSEPNEDLEFHGVMRFYFQDSGQKVATKCIRVASDATSQAVIETLIEKFRPDMRMLSVPEYALYEIHENGEERKLGLEEKPLLVQLNWHIDDREGRFLLRRIDDKTNAQGVGFSEGSSFRRKLSKREKKQMKKQEKLSRLKSSAAGEQDENSIPLDQNGVAEKLYTELPETSFTRSISNPEAVMRRRRQQKLERKLQQFRSKDGGPDTGGTLKIYGEALCKDVPYKTLLLSVRDSAAQVVREMLSKYGLDKVDPQQYCLVQVNGENTNTHQEYILDDDECPLAILMNHPSTRGSIMFHVRRRPADYVPRKRKKKPAGKWSELDHRYEDERLPFLVELNPDGTDIPNGAGMRHRLQPNVTEVGSDRRIGPQAVQGQTLILSGSTVMDRHCVIAFTDNIVTLTPYSKDAHTYVDNHRIYQTTILKNGAIIKFGRMHTFRFIDPAPEDRIRQRHDSNRQLDYSYDRRSPDATSQEISSEKYRSGSGTPNDGRGSNPPSPTKNPASPRSPTHNANTPETTHNYETTFDLDGNVETASLTSSRDGNRLSQYDRHPRGNDPILPAVLEFLEETEEAFLHAVITDVEPSAPQFKLAPTYTLYLAARYRASTHYRPELQPTERAHRLTVMLANVATMIQRVIQERYMDASSLALWLANGSELLHMLKSDRHVGAFSTRAQDILADAVHTAFASLVRCVSLELAPAMSQFMADADEPAKEAGVLQIFSNTMALLRRCRVNAALTIQLFSHLFHAINATAFNALVSNGNLCVRWFGRRLKIRLNALETWAERQGLELASQCHLATIMQATHLLQAPKYNADELATLSSTCYKLNSLQVRALLQKYQPADDEPRLPAELIENIVRVTETMADTLARADGREIRLEEDPTLALTLLLPKDGYSCEVIRGVPPGLAEFLAPLQRDGLCRMAPQPTSSGYWTIYMIDHNNLRSPSAMSNRSGGYSGHMSQNQGQPEIQVIKLHKSTNGMGLSIVAAKGAGQDRLGIYIKSVVAGGAADADGRLTAGDQLLKVDGQSLVGIAQERAAEYLVRTGPIVTLEVAKQGAIYHGLATLLSQPSPVMTRAHKARPKSEHLEPPRLPEMAPQPSTSHSMGNLLCVPKQSAYQERLVDWDVEEIQPGAGTFSQMPLSQDRQYFSQFQPSIGSQSYQNLATSHCYAMPSPQAKMSTRQTANVSCLSMCPIKEAPLNDEFQRPRYYWPSRREIPVIHEPNQTFLTIPSHVERYPPYPLRETCRPQNSVIGPQYGYYSKDKTELIFPCKNRSQESLSSLDAVDNIERSETLGRKITSFDEESTIPYIDQPDDNVDTFMRSKENIFAEDISECPDYESRDSSEFIDPSSLHIDVLNEQYKTQLYRKVRSCDESSLRDNLNIVEDKIPMKSLKSIEIIGRPGTGSRSRNIDVPLRDGSQCRCRNHDSQFSREKLINSEFNKDNCSLSEAIGVIHVPCTGEMNVQLENVNLQDTTEDSNNSDSVESQQEEIEMKEIISTPKMHTIMPELNLDLSGLNSDLSSEESNTDKCWKSPEEVRLGCGRVAALAKHFSKLGEAGLIKFKSKKFVATRQFVSEPDIASPRSPEITVRKNGGNSKEFKSESDLLKSDKSVATTPEKEWSMILLDIQAKNDIEVRKNVEVMNKDESTNTEDINFESNTDADTEPGELKKSDSKLSLAEQQEIIEQLKEFTNLDNTDAPLFIPDKSDKIYEITDDGKTSNSDKETMTESFEDSSVTNSRINSIGIPSYHALVGSMRLEGLRKHSLPNLLNALNISPGIKISEKMNKLEKYWSLKDLMSSDHLKFDSLDNTNDSPKYFIFPTCSRVVSAPEINNENANIFEIRSVTPNYGSGNVTIRSTISISEDECDKDNLKSDGEISEANIIKKESHDVTTDTEREELSKDKEKEPEKTKFPNSFIRTRKMSKSCDEIVQKSKFTSQPDFDKPVCKSLERINTARSGSLSSTGSSPARKFAHNYRNVPQTGYRVAKPALRDTLRVKSCEIMHVPLKSNTLPAKSGTRVEKPIRKKSLIVQKRSKSDLDLSERKPTPRFERGDWIFREFSPLEKSTRTRPRRMSERDLPSRLGHDATPQQIHSSKSVPALHNVGTEGKQQHEVFNPGYSRASSSNSVTPPVHPPPMPAMNGATTLRSRSSHNLHDPMRAGMLPPTGLVSRQQSSPNLNPNQMHVNIQNSLQSNEAERFYQNLSVYRNQDAAIKQQPSPPQPSDDRSPLHTQKNLRGSQNSLNRPTVDMSQGRDRPISAYIPQGQQQSYSNNQLQHQGPPPRSQSSRDIIRQEAKLQEMQEEVRRRELRGGAPMLNQYRPNYNVRPMGANQAANTIRPTRPIGSTPNLGPNSPTYNARQMGPNYGYTESQYSQYGQFGKHPQPTPGPNQYPMGPKGKNEPIRGHGTGLEPGRDFGPQDARQLMDTRQMLEQSRQFPQNGSQYSNGGASDPRNGQYPNDNLKSQNGSEVHQGNPENPPARPILPEDVCRESPPPPPPNTSTHPLYSKQPDSRYTASMQDPPRGGYYTAPGPTQQPRQYQYSATNPWQREEREKEQARRREAARQWRDQQIAELSALPHRTPQQEEQLRALQLERDFQKRAEEVANQQDDDEESNDLEHESTQRVQGLLRMAANQDRANQVNQQQQQQNLSRSGVNNQSIRGALSPQPVSSQIQSTNIPLHTASNQQSGSGAGGSSYGGQSESGGMHMQNQSQNQNLGQGPMSPSYNTGLGTSQKSGSPAGSTQQNNEERERQRRIEELKRKQAEFDENQRKREEEIRQQQQQLQIHHQQMQQLYQQQQQQQQQQHQQQQQQSNLRSQHQLHPGMLRLDNLVINGPSSPPASQNGGNDAPPPPERGSSYAVMSQQSALRSNSSTASNVQMSSHPTTTIKRVSFHDPNANTEPALRNTSSAISTNPSTISMDTIREDPNNFINDAENLLASPKTPEGPGGTFMNATPGVIGAQEVYKDPRQKRLAEKQKQQQNLQMGAVPEKLSFKEKMKMFAMETGEDGTPRDKVKISRAQREIDNIGSPLSPNNNNRS